MVYKDFSREIWDQISQATEGVLKTKGPHFAVFDADGTLWDHDAGNGFFDYEIENNLLPLPQNPWEYVHSIKKTKPQNAFLWLAQIHKGLSIDQVRLWAMGAKESSHKKGLPKYFPAIHKLIKLFKEKGIHILVVTASVKWSIEPLVETFGLSPDDVLGVQTRVENGIITDIQEGEITYREGKAKAILEKTKGIRPFFACGNTMGDFYMLDLATHIALAVRAHHEGVHTKGASIASQEQALYEKAIEKNWLTHSFS